jgi:benzoyl-CoA reductase/2-hydroxyglutaryl-CoA dehydratase subunit BcrC/BadD/HgdB
VDDIVIGETTCEGKKKMFELIAGKKPKTVFCANINILKAYGKTIQTIF